jgi:hypothetical protein
MVEGSVIVEDVAVPGYAEVFDGLRTEDPVEVAGSLRDYGVREHLPLPGGRGVVEVFVDLVNRLRGRKLEADLGEHDVDVEWLGFHVPPGGRGTLVLSNAGEQRVGLTLQVMGSGWGSGRAIKLSVEEDYGERADCMRLLLQVSLHATRYSMPDGRSEIATTVLRARRVRVVSVPGCPSCGQPAAEFNPVDYEIDEQLGIDLTADRAGAKRSRTFELAEEDEFDLGFTLPFGSVGSGKLGLTARRAFSATCATTFEFPAGRSFTPFRDVSGRLQLPVWAVD